MTKWDIDPVGVLATLSTTGEAAGRLESAIDAMVRDVASAASAAGTLVQGSGYEAGVPYAPGKAPGSGSFQASLTAPSNPTGPVAEALGKYLEHRQKKMEAMAARTVNAITGAANATKAYQEGNLQQAANAQERALHAPEKVDMPGANGGGTK
ncbi:DUF6507 family protein [Streptomyces sp. T-3]|nr:DUF6507 family protein [Streptomyces sp. T-3]